MSVFYLLMDLCAELDRMLNSFWWGNGRYLKGIRWIWGGRSYVFKKKGGNGVQKIT